MAISFRRMYYQNIKYSLTCMIISIFCLFCISFTIQNHSLKHLNFFHIQYEKEILFTNQSLGSSLTYNIETTNFYPYLPIQIFTKNRQKFFELKNPTKKLILITYPFFGDPTWAMNSLKNKTNSGNMSELYCPFLSNYCEITTDLTRFKQADAVVYHIRDYINRSDEFIKQRHSSQRFIFTLWEPPINTPDLRSYNQFFNWSMTYRFDSHIFASYYFESSYRLKTNTWLNNIVSNYQSNNEDKLILTENINIKKKRGTAAALISNCETPSKKRWLIILELQKYIDITIYGKCGHPCPKSLNSNQTINCREYIAENYYFLLSFENSYCQDYITEKLFTTLPLPIIPVVFGQINYTRYLPRSAIIDVQQFSSIYELANRLIEIKNNLTLYYEYFQWKKDFLWKRFTHFMTPFCDLCLRLHLDSTPNIIDNVHQWWFHKTCQPEVTKYF